MNLILPTDELMFFRGVGCPHQSGFNDVNIKVLGISRDHEYPNIFWYSIPKDRRIALICEPVDTQGILNDVATTDPKVLPFGKRWRSHGKSLWFIGD